jgi:hypothetical protein
MIARIWHGTVPTTKSDEYLKLMRTVALTDYRSVPGNCGAFALREIQGDIAHFLMLTFWESLEAVVNFAGADIEVAKYYEFDRSFLLKLEPFVKHYELYND